MSNFPIADITFKLKDTFLEEYKDKQPDWGPLGYITYKRTYARPKPDGTTEEFVDTLERVVNGTFSIQKNYCLKHNRPWDDYKAQRTAQNMFKAMWNFKFLPPGRGLWTMGTSHVSKNGSLALNNCAFVSTASLQVNAHCIGIIMDMLMLGVGVGFDTVGTAFVTNPIEGYSHKTIPDTREGWIESTERLINSYIVPQLSRPKFDYSAIRKAGEPIKGFGGVSSGPGPLIDLHNSIQEIMEGRIGSHLTSIDILDICNLIGKCVVSGNVRRSAEVCLGDPDDRTFIEAKQDLDKLTSHRWASNNSIYAHIGMDYNYVGSLTAKNGEPGYMWIDNSRKFGRFADGIDNKDFKIEGANPCMEQHLEDHEVCCLVETFPRRHANLAEYINTLKLAYLYAKTVTLVPTHIPEVNRVMYRNRRIGCSQSGIVGAFNKHGRREILKWCDAGYKFIAGLDKQYSSWLGIPESIRMTSVKPSGTVSLLPGETPGIHYPHSKYYIRRIRFAANSELISTLTDAGYHIEPDISNPTNTIVVSFPVMEQDFSLGKSNVSMWEQLENVAQYQHWWADNAVSATITFNPIEASDIPRALELYESRLKAISFLPLVDHGYKQAPYETIDEATYKSMSSKLKPFFLNLSGNSKGSSYCDSDKCTL